MKSILIGLLGAGLLLASFGCQPANTSPTAFVGDKGTVVAPQQFFGDVGIKGDGWSLTATAGSHLTKLKIWGNRNTFTVEDDVVLYEINIFGDGNTISVPQNQFIVRVTNIGSKNQIIRRPPTTPTATGYTPYTPYVAPAPTETAPPAGTLEEPTTSEPPYDAGRPVAPPPPARTAPQPAPGAQPAGGGMDSGDDVK